MPSSDTKVAQPLERLEADLSCRQERSRALSPGNRPKRTHSRGLARHEGFGPGSGRQEPSTPCAALIIPETAAQRRWIDHYATVLAGTNNCPSHTDANSYRMKHISILGSTGSIGRSTLSVVESYPERFQILPRSPPAIMLTLHSSRLQRWKPRLISVAPKRMLKSFALV